MTIFLISALTGIVADLVAKKASKEVIYTPSVSSIINDCANGSPCPPPRPPPPLLFWGCLTATTLLAVLVVVWEDVTDVLCIDASLVATIASCVVSNKPLAE